MASGSSASALFLVYGGAGFLGTQIVRFLVEQGFRLVDDVPSDEAPSRRVALSRIRRLSDRASFVHEIESIRPTHVLNCLGRTRGPKTGDAQTIDYLSTDDPRVLDENIRDNLYLVTMMADVCQSRGIHYTYVGTSSMYCYDDAHPATDESFLGFTETDPANFTGNAYSVVKAYADRMLTEMHEKCGESAATSCILNLRFAMPITGDEHPRSLLTKLSGFRQLHGPLQANSITVLPALLPVFVRMCLERTSGTFNFTCPGALTHAQLLQIYKEIVNPSQTWQVHEPTAPVAASATPAAAAAAAAARPPTKASHRLDTRKLQAIVPTLPTLDEAVRAVCHQIVAQRRVVPASQEHPQQ